MIIGLAQGLRLFSMTPAHLNCSISFLTQSWCFSGESVQSLWHQSYETCVYVHNIEFSMTNVLTTSRKCCLVFVEKLAKWLVSFVRNVILRQHTSPKFLNITGWYQEVTVRSFWKHLCGMFPVSAMILNWLDLCDFNIVGLKVFRSDECDDVVTWSFWSFNWPNVAENFHMVEIALYGRRSGRRGSDVTNDVIIPMKAM